MDSDTSDEIHIGDGVQYVWGMPGPDYDSGTVIALNDDGSFDVYFDPKTEMSGRSYPDGIVNNLRLNDFGGIGGVFKIKNQAWVPKWPKGCEYGR